MRLHREVGASQPLYGLSRFGPNRDGFLGRVPRFWCIARHWQEARIFFIFSEFRPVIGKYFWSGGRANLKIRCSAN